jgi:poly(3-hydroxyalkanoate) depolymerase
VGQEKIRVAATSPAHAHPIPLFIFNGNGASIELLEPLMRRLSGFRVITFDLPGVGESGSSSTIRRLSGFADLAADLLDAIGVGSVFVMGVSWGGGLAQQFAYDYPKRCVRLVLAASSTGHVMVPPSPRVMFHMSTPLRFQSPEYFKKIAGIIYGGDFRTDSSLVERHAVMIAPPTSRGFFTQLFALIGWTSIFWLHRIQQPTLVMAGEDDPIVTMSNARILNTLIPNSELVVFDCGHLFLLTRLTECVAALDSFLGRSH